MLMFRGVSFFLVTEMTYFVAYEKFLLLFVEHKVTPKSDALNFQFIFLGVVLFPIDVPRLKEHGVITLNETDQGSDRIVEL